MVCDNNVFKGRDAVMLVRNDADTLWEVMGGVKSRGNNTDNPVEDTTSTSTTGEYSESEWTGYSQDTISVSGVVDNRTGQTVTVGGTDYTVAATTRLDQLAHSGNRCAKIMLVYPYKSIEADYNITSYNDTGDTPGLLNFDASLQTKSTPVVVYL